MTPAVLDAGLLASELRGQPGLVLAVLDHEGPRIHLVLRPGTRVSGLAARLQAVAGTRIPIECVGTGTFVHDIEDGPAGWRSARALATSGTVLAGSFAAACGPDPAARLTAPLGPLSRRGHHARRLVAGAREELRRIRSTVEMRGYACRQDRDSTLVALRALLDAPAAIDGEDLGRLSIADARADFTIRTGITLPPPLLALVARADVPAPLGESLAVAEVEAILAAIFAAAARVTRWLDELAPLPDDEAL